MRVISAQAVEGGGVQKGGNWTSHVLMRAGFVLYAFNWIVPSQQFQRKDSLAANLANWGADPCSTEKVLICV